MNNITIQLIYIMKLLDLLSVYLAFVVVGNACVRTPGERIIQTTTMSLCTLAGTLWSHDIFATLRGQEVLWWGLSWWLFAWAFLLWRFKTRLWLRAVFVGLFTAGILEYLIHTFMAAHDGFPDA